MERIKASLNRYVIIATVEDIHEEFGSKYVGGVGQDCAFERYSLGWYVTFAGSHEALFFGKEEPAFDIGDRIKITFERISDDALPLRTPVK